MDDEPSYSETTLSLKLSYCDANPPRQLIFEGCSSAARPDEPALSLGLPEPPSTSSRRPLRGGMLRIKREKEAGNDEEEEGDRGARKKLRLSKEQAALLEDKFKEHSTLNSKQKHALARQLKLLPRQVEVWFQNRRARTKLKKTQVEREILRKCCDALREENKRLRKELHELKSTKCSATQLMVICSSCKKVIHDGGNGTSGSVSGDMAKPRFFNPFAHSTVRVDHD